MFRFLSSLTIARKLAIGFSILIILAALVGGHALLQLESYGHRSNVVAQAGQMEALLLQARTEEKNFMLNGDDARLQEAVSLGQQAGTVARNLADELVVPSDLELLKSVRDGSARYTQSLQDLARTQSARDSAVAELEESARITASRLSTEPQLYVAEGALKKMRGYERQFLIQHDDDAVGRFDKDAERALQSIEGTYISDDAKAEITGLFQRYTAAFDEAVSASRQLRELEEQLVTTARSILDAAQSLQTIQLGKMERDHDRATILISLGILAAIVIGVLLAWALSRSIIRPLKEAVGLATQVADGNLRAHAESDRSDELGQLINALGQMIANLRNLVGDINSGSHEIATSTGQLSSVTEQTSQGMTDQRDQTDQVATAMNEMVATVGEVAKSAEEAFDAANRASTTANDGDTAVGETLSYVSELNNLLERVQGQVQTLQSDTRNIGTVLDVIKAVAEQTNLLALNAAIEAARAGEQGRGFAVVADEVRSLAQRTQSSAEEIESLIDKLVHSAEASVTAMSEGTDLAGRTLDRAQTAGRTIKAITQSVEDIRQLNSQIATAAEQQSSVAEDINQNVTRIRDISDQSASAATQVASSSTELAQLGENLRTRVARFSV
ncbi:HAMP domain-containing methyl-accepting chemotaxis protein [Marinobacter sp. JSM 1782161]|uniref:HAMP domain-containing methyl-accepting chemotaxis protein n=1 Tax=Marinobacter sp. JSM 1782161 TaxID=2685906 RepID=UPI001403703B|nr:methyl-accepting chemotaxis protein [Marinobacter sp. JSM 1782161]